MNYFWNKIRNPKTPDDQNPLPPPSTGPFGGAKESGANPAFGYPMAAQQYPSQQQFVMPFPMQGGGCSFNTGGNVNENGEQENGGVKALNGPSVPWIPPGASFNSGNNKNVGGKQTNKDLEVGNYGGASASKE